MDMTKRDIWDLTRSFISIGHPIDMTGTQVKIAATIDQFYDEGAPMGIYGVKYKEAVGKLEQQAQDEVVSR